METQQIAELIDRVLTGDAWHGPNLEQTLEGITPEQAARRSAGVHTIWELVLHMTGWTREVMSRLGGRAAQEPAGGDWPAVGDPTPERWEAAKAELFAAHRDLRDAVARLDTAALQQPVVDYRDSALGTGLSQYVTLHGLLQHTLYHAGQIAMLKRMHE